MALRMPIVARAGEPGISFTVELDGDVFRVALRYNDRDDRFYMSIYDEDDAPIAIGLKVVLDTPMMQHVVDARRPRGEFVAVDVAGSTTEPNLTTLGARVDLLFVSWAEATS
jgi:hypothetical protein